MDLVCYNVFCQTKKIRHCWHFIALIALTLVGTSCLYVAFLQSLQNQHNLATEMCQVISCVKDDRLVKTCAGTICIPTPPELIQHDCTIMFLKSGILERIYLTSPIRDAKLNATMCSRRELNEEQFPGTLAKDMHGNLYKSPGPLELACWIIGGLSSGIALLGLIAHVMYACGKLKHHGEKAFAQKTEEHLLQ